MISFARRFLQDRDGATAIEYGLILALIALAIIGVVTAMSGSLITTLNTISNRL